jgi:hypothetical protein
MSVALLASVPEEHLVSGMEKVQSEGRVAFGSKNWELFSRLDSLVEGIRCDVLIYASDPSSPINPPTATWTARYVGSSLAVNGAHSQGMKYRPNSTLKYPLDNKGNWVVFWEINNLGQLQPGIKIGALRGYEKPNRYLKDFIPHGPILIQNK